MTFEELDKRYPNGLDDAELASVEIDYRKHQATFHLSLRRSPPDSPDADVYTRAVLRLRGIYYISIEAPDRDHLFYPQENRVVVDGLPEDPDDFELFRSLRPKLPVGAFCCRFFVHDWNSFIHVAAAEAEFS